jgi:hypothetical protein
MRTAHHKFWGADTPGVPLAAFFYRHGAGVGPLVFLARPRARTRAFGVKRFARVPARRLSAAHS